MKWLTKKKVIVLGILTFLTYELYQYNPPPPKFGGDCPDEPYLVIQDLKTEKRPLQNLLSLLLDDFSFYLHSASRL